MSIDKTLAIFNDYIGQKEFSNKFNEMLSDNHLNESDGYLIKFKVYNEVINEYVNENNVIFRINSLINHLSNRRSYNGHEFNYDYEILRYLANADDEKVFCEGCGKELLYIDKYCYGCGKKQNPQITLLELLSSINSEYIKPGDIIKVNEDFSIDKTSYEQDRQPTESMVNDSIESVYNHGLKKKEIEHRYLKIIILDHIHRNDSLRFFSDEYPYHNPEEVILTVQELENENLISKSVKYLVKDYLSLFKEDNDGKFDEILNSSYTLSQYAVFLLNNHPYVLFYYQVIKDSVVDDIVEFDRLCQTRQPNQSFESLTLNLIHILRKKFISGGFYTEYHSSYDMEAYVYELFGDHDNRLISLFEKFIIKSGFNIERGINPLEEDYLSYLRNNIYSLNLEVASIKYLFNQAFIGLNEDEILFKENDLINILIRYLNGESIEKLNFDLIKIYSDKKKG
ncbi:MAG: hypothetical protein J6S29_05885 [Methanosphaera sp.]|nr:hypothetical protein [Methanosphaera sp.]